MIEDMFQTRQGLQQQPVIMVCGDLNLRSNRVVECLQDLGPSITTPLTAVGEGWGE